jgi:hypothetical protein
MKTPHIKAPWRAQGGEDRTCLRLFRRIGIRSKTAVEFGAHDGCYKSNTAYFRERHGWTCFLFDAEPRSDLVIEARITAENVNDVFRAHGVPDDLDLLSIDIDGNDLWVWKAITYQPQVVVIEYNPRWRPIRSRTIPYDPDRGAWDQTDYYGASAGALVKVGREKGYVLAASTQYNLIFGLQGLIDRPMGLNEVARRKKRERADPLNREWMVYE